MVELEKDVVTERDALRQEKKDAESERKFRRGLIHSIGIALGVAAVLALIILGAISLLHGGPETVNDEASLTLSLVSDGTEEPEPGYSEGIHSWTQWEEEANDKDRQRLLDLRKITSEDTKKWAAEEQIFGTDFTIELKPGDMIENSGWNGSSWYPVTGYIVKEGDILFLGGPDGVIAVKKSCGNPVALYDNDVCVRPDGEGLPGTPTNSVYPNLPAPPLPEGVEVGRAEETEDNRGLDPDHTGLSGGETPSAEETIDDRLVGEAPEGTTDPDTSESEGQTYDSGSSEPTDF